jgi:hypothetical protein
MLKYNKIHIIEIYAVILSVVLHGCETWFLIFREEHRLKAFKNTVLSKIDGPKRKEITGGWRKPYTEELPDLYSPPDVIKVMK